MSEMKTLEVKNRAEWRAWLAENFDKEQAIWLVYYKKGSGIVSIDYNESVEEGLCFGWVDSVIRRIDDKKYARKFTPRKPESNWSESNIKRVEKLIAAGLMTKYGMRLVDAAKESGNWDQPTKPPKIILEIPPEFAKALKKNQKAQDNFNQLAKTSREEYIGWIASAKRVDTIEKRIQEAILLLEKGEKLGLR